jgi:hypothetical protein
MIVGFKATDFLSVTKSLKGDILDHNPHISFCEPYLPVTLLCCTAGSAGADEPAGSVDGEPLAGATRLLALRNLTAGRGRGTLTRSRRELG